MKLFFVTPLFYSIGNAAEEIYWASARAAIVGKKLIVIAPYRWTQILDYKICNKYIFNLETQDDIRIGQLQNFFINLYRFYINTIFFLKRCISINLRKFFLIYLPEGWNFPQVGKKQCWPELKRESAYIYKFDPIIEKVHSLPALRMPAEVSLKCSERLKELVRSDKKFVCLHVRESGYHKDELRRPYRNADIKNYLLAINYLLDQGMTVFRMGDSSMKKLSIKHKNLIDYPFTNLKSPEMDFYLIQNCEYYIGMQSGILDVALMFKKPVLTLNMYDWFFAHPLKYCDRGLLKKIEIETALEKKIFSTREWINLPFYYTNNREIYPSNIHFIENSDLEILNAISEFHKDYLHEFLRPPSKSMLLIQDEFRMASKLIIENEDLSVSAGFLKLNSSHKARLILRNLSTKGFLYDFS